MRNLINLFVLTLTLSTAAVAQDSIMFRTDMKMDREPSHTVGLMTPELEVWGFALPDFPIVEAGRLGYWKLGEHASVLAGGYLSYWTVPQQLYAEPYSIWKVRAGDTSSVTKLGAYAPLTGDGSWQLFGDTSVSWKIADGLSVGPAADWWLTEGSKPKFGLGAAATYKTEHATFGLRGLARPGGSYELRLEVTLF